MENFISMKWDIDSLPCCIFVQLVAAALANKGKAMSLKSTKWLLGPSDEDTAA